MDKTRAAANPDAYVEALTGWRRSCVEALRAGVHAQGPLQEVIKWGHLVYLANGPVLLIRAEAERVLFGFWRGKQLRDIEPRLKPGGKYQMASLELRDGDALDPAVVASLTRAAIDLNARMGDPTRDARV
jgi:hypothetical protein